MLKFLVFADLHYKKMMYAASVGHLREIMQRAADNNVDFVIHLGDLCNDYLGSPELIGYYLENPFELPVFGVYGNHELESCGNSMAVVTPLLSNRKVNFGGEDSGFWYTDLNSFRLIGLDTNYSYCEELGEWQHNTTASWGAPKGNILENSLSPRQLEWLDERLLESFEKGQKALVFSHSSFSPFWSASPDANAVRQLFEKYKGTVLMALNGHLHTDHFAVTDEVAYFDVNSALNGYWAVTDGFHYSDGHTFEFCNYNEEGKALSTEKIPLNCLSQAKNTWFFEKPLSAIVTVDDHGEITVEGSETEWMYGVEPSEADDGCIPCIRSRV